MALLPPPPANYPRVDAGELLILLLRFFAAVFLMFVTGYCMLRHYFAYGTIMAVIAVFTQRAAIVLYRRMREEYAQALAALEEAPSVAQESPAHAG